MKRFGNRREGFGYATMLLVLLVTTIWVIQFTLASPLAGITTLVSVDEQGHAGIFPSSRSAISSDGRYVAFTSTYLVSADTTFTDDVYVHDRQTGQPSLVSVASDGTLGNGWSHSPDVSGDGRYVVFASNASNLVAGDTNGALDVFLHDQQTGQTSRISVDSNGNQVIWDSGRPVISADGRYVAFQSLGIFDTGLVTEGYDLFLHDRQTGQVSLVSDTYDGSLNLRNAEAPFISANGDYILFWSYGDAFVAGDNNNAADVFFYDHQADELSLVSVSGDGTQGNNDSFTASVSDDGRYVAFDSFANNLVTGDTNGMLDIFVHDRQTGETIRISNGLSGQQANGDSRAPTISGDGRYIVFESEADNLVVGDTNGKFDIFVYDRQTGEISRVSVSTTGIEGDDSSYTADISTNGQHIAFESLAENLSNNDGNNQADIFAHSLQDLTGNHFVYLPFVIK